MTKEMNEAKGGDKLPGSAAHKAAEATSQDVLTDFLKVITVQQYTRKSLQKIGPHAIALAEAEGLAGHAESVRVRMK